VGAIGRGLYVPTGTKSTNTTHGRAATACQQRGLSAVGPGLSQADNAEPHEVWLAIDVKARKPNADWPPSRIVRFSGAARTFGVERHVIEVSGAYHVTAKDGGRIA